MSAPVYKRILLKLSGEALMGDDSYGINRAVIERTQTNSYFDACHDRFFVRKTAPRPGDATSRTVHFT